jgi:hypothetical protein
MNRISAPSRALLNAAGTALSEGLERPERFKDGEEFRRSLVRVLGQHAGFAEAAKNYHAHVMKSAPTSKGQTPRVLVPAGRVQAPRHDTPKGKA